MAISKNPARSGVEQIKVRVSPDGRVDRENAARFLGREPKTLACWQSAGKGPRSVLVGGRRFYYLHDLMAYVSAEVGENVASEVV
ncbi:MAG TPA: hypothetical protein VKU84_07700 [Stellaceae bacterium]|nr:hypothetical protein [Stellaceae bacterium]